MKIPIIDINNNKNEFKFKNKTSSNLLCSVSNNKLYYENIYFFLASKTLFNKDIKMNGKK